MISLLIYDKAFTKYMYKIWRHIVLEETRGKDVEEVDLPFRSAAVYYYWNIVSRQEWKIRPEAMESARAFIETHGDQCKIALLDLGEVPHASLLAFEVTDFMRAWAKRTEELAMDSTCEFVIDVSMKS